MKNVVVTIDGTAEISLLNVSDCKSLACSQVGHRELYSSNQNVTPTVREMT